MPPSSKRICLLRGDRKITRFTDSAKETVKKAEIRFAVSIACHASFKAADHLAEIGKQIGRGSDWNDLDCKRRKCSALVENCVASSLKEELSLKLATTKYSILLDESTDVNTMNILTVSVRYYCTEEERIVDDFLDSVPVVHTTGEDFWTALEKIITVDFKISFKNCIGIGSDGASNMVGCHNSLWTRFKVAAPQALQLKCISHSYDLCVRKAMEHPGSMPSSLSKLLHAIPRWFGSSSIRQHNFEKISFVINQDNINSREPFQKFDETRWLARAKVVNGILIAYWELVAYFEAVEEGEANTVTKYDANEILSLLKDKRHFLFLTFLAPVVAEFEKINAYFQSSKDENHSEIFRQMEIHYKTFKARIYRNNKLLSYNSIYVDYGVKFTRECAKYYDELNNSTLPGVDSSENAREQVSQVKRICFTFLEVALQELDKRIPSNWKTFTRMNSLTPEKVLSSDRCPFSSLPFLEFCEEKLEDIESQYRRVNQVDWISYEPFNGKIPDPVGFYGIVRNYCVSGEYVFRELADFVLSVYSIPLSNAYIERMFSMISFVKNKWHNRLSNATVNSIIRLKCHLYSRNVCCSTFKITPKMIERHNQYMYSFRSCPNDLETDNKDDADEDLDHLLDDINLSLK